MKKIIISVSIIAFVALVSFAILKNYKIAEVETSIEEYTPKEEISKEQNRMTIITLYFLDPSTEQLIPEARSIDVKELLSNPYQFIIDRLIEGSENSQIGKTIPEGTIVNSINLNGEELTIDFNEAFLTKYEKGSEVQTKMFYSIVNTFLELKEVNSVRLLVNGEKINEMDEAFVRLN